MPQAPSPNMQIIWPSDHDDNDAWDAIMDTAVRVKIDGHDHTGSNGARIPTAALRIDADVSWAFGGAQFAITDLRAIDFSPQPASGVVALAGALFLNSADSELYWRAVGGGNVKLTAGTSLNVAGFTGGIGGDYAATGALVVFDDSTDSYWFQQQVGAGVRQYARMRSADVDLYEFKANPAAGVPVQRVRLASPAGLALSYALTFPGAVPGAQALVQVDATGLIVFSNALAANQSITLSGTGDIKHGTRTIQLAPALFTPTNGVGVTFTPSGTISVSAGSMLVMCGIPGLRVGDRITAVRFRGADSGTGPTKFQGTVGIVASGALGSTAVSAGSGLLQTLSVTSGLPSTMAAGSVPYVNFFTQTGTNFTELDWCEVDYDHP